MFNKIIKTIIIIGTKKMIIVYQRISKARLPEEAIKADNDEYLVIQLLVAKQR